jgi:hypothetical protein
MPLSFPDSLFFTASGMMPHRLAKELRLSRGSQHVGSSAAKCNHENELIYLKGEISSIDARLIVFVLRETFGSVPDLFDLTQPPRIERHDLVWYGKRHSVLGSGDCMTYTGCEPGPERRDGHF